MTTVSDFIDRCTQDFIDIELYNCNTESCIKVNIDDLRYDYQYAYIMESDFESWDIQDGIMCINYS